MIRVLCVDDHRIVREGIALIIGQQPDIEVVGLAASVEEATAQFRRLQPDVTLMDLRLGAGTGVDAIRQIRAEFPDARIVVLTMYEGDEDIHRAHQAGATTYLLKDMLSDELIRVIREVHEGKRPVIPMVEAQLAQRKSRPTLTARELEVLELVAQGMRNKEIAASLALSEGTVQVHVKNILAKLNVNDRTSAVQIGLRRGLIHIS